MLITFQGDANPRVVALQLLLNRFRITDPNLKVDGHYGGKKILRPLLQGVAPPMHNMGFVEFHSCRTAQGPNGTAMISDLSAIWKAPVTAGLSRQKGGGNLNFVLQQPSFTSFPEKATLKSWASGRQAMPSV